MVNTKSQKRVHNALPSGSEQEDVLAIGLDSRTNDLYDMVFGIDLLRETIIDYVVHDMEIEGGVSKQNVFSCRLVQKSWLDSVFKCLVKSGKSLTILGAEYWNTIDQFEKIYKPSSRLTIRFEIYFTSGNFPQRLQSLEKCLHLCGSGLVELNLRFPDDDYRQQTEKSLFNFVRQNFNLPVLHKILFCVSKIPILSNTNEVNGNIHIGSMTQLLISQCVRLKCFEFVAGDFRGEPLPTCLGNIFLPDTITTLELQCNGITNHLEPLIKNNLLPKLTDLTVEITKILYGEKEWIYPVLNRVRHTLKKLKILQMDVNMGEKEAWITKVDPPIMNCLESVIIHAELFQWADEMTNLHQKLPVLQKIDLQHVTSTILKKWTENSNFAFLTDVTISYKSGNIDHLTLDDAQLMHTAFPQVTKLNIFTNCMEGRVEKALQFLFQNMVQLRILTLKLNYYDYDNPRYLDALLLGIPIELIEDLGQECPRGKLWEAVQLRVDKQFSISNLSELRELNLVFKTFVDTPTFVSEKVMEFVTSSMPNLQKINLPQPYMASDYSPANVRKWKRTGTIFNWGSNGPKRLQCRVQCTE